MDNPRGAVLAPPHRRPTYIAATLDALLEPYPPVTRERARASCGGWTATAAEGDGALTLTGDGTGIDGLRALAAAAWSSRDDNGGLDAGQVDAALGRLARAGLPT